MKNIFKKVFVMIFVSLFCVGMVGCAKKSDVKTVVVPKDTELNVLSGKYKNTSDNNIWQFNANGSLLITQPDDAKGYYKVCYKDTSMYLTNEDGASIEFFYTVNNDNSIDVTINGVNSDTSTLQKLDE